MKMIGILGHAGAGKDTTADILCAAVPMARRAFADALRAEIADAFGIDQRMLLERHLRDSPLRALDLQRCAEQAFVRDTAKNVVRTAFTPREIMRRWGDWRKLSNPDYWICLAASARIAAQVDGHRAMVWTDVRYPAEAAWIRSHAGVLWRVVRPGLAQDRTHDSETAADQIAVDATIVNDGDMDQLRMRVVDLVGLLEIGA